MKQLNKKEASKKFAATAINYASVCNSCACSGGACVTCKGCKDKGSNVKEVEMIYKDNK